MDRIKLLPLLVVMLVGCSQLPTPIAMDPTATVISNEVPTSMPLPPTPTLSPLPIPTEIPPMTSSEIEKMILNGEYDQVRTELMGSGSEGIEGVWQLAKTEFLAENSTQALEHLRTITQEAPDSFEATRSWFLLAETYYGLERYEEATKAYLEFQKRSPLFPEFVLAKLGNSYSLSGQYPLAIETYNNLLKLKPNDEATLIKIGRAYLFGDQPVEALAIFDQVFKNTEDDYTKAQIDLLAGQALINSGKNEEAYVRWRHAVENYPLSYDAYSAMQGLATYEQPVDDLQKAYINYYAGNYPEAIAGFTEYISKNPQHDGTAFFYIGLIDRATGDYDGAIKAFDTLIEKYPENKMFNAAWDERATTLWVYMDNYETAATSLELFANTYPANNLAATYLLEAGRIRERNKQLDKAARVWEALPLQFPDSAERYTALMYAGVTRYRLKEYEKARENFGRALQISKNEEEIVRANFWLGKAAFALNEENDANTYWQKVMEMDRIGYYGLRASDLSNGREMFSPQPLLTEGAAGIPIREREEAAAWIKLTAGMPAETDLLQPGHIQDDPHFVQGLEFWNMGYFEQAKAEFDFLIDANQSDPANLFRLGNYLLDIGHYKAGITVIRDCLTALGYDDHYKSTTVPPYFNHVRYGLYYFPLVSRESTKYGLDPLLVTSIIRQESLFEGFIHSSAGARGVMQIMPDTGKSIADQMGWPTDFNADLLYQPNVSIALGGYYINQNMNYLDKDIPAVLAGYNAGPGNAAIWQSLADGDPDLLVEVIRYGETRDYIKGIYETYRMYQKLYTANQ